MLKVNAKYFRLKREIGNRHAENAGAVKKEPDSHQIAIYYGAAIYGQIYEE